MVGDPSGVLIRVSCLLQDLPLLRIGDSAWFGDLDNGFTNGPVV